MALHSFWDENWAKVKAKNTDSTNVLSLMCLETNVQFYDGSRAEPAFSLRHFAQGLLQV